MLLVWKFTLRLLLLSSSTWSNTSILIWWVKITVCSCNLPSFATYQLSLFWPTQGKANWGVKKKVLIIMVTFLNNNFRVRWALGMHFLLLKHVLNVQLLLSFILGFKHLVDIGDHILLLVCKLVTREKTILGYV